MIITKKKNVISYPWAGDVHDYLVILNLQLFAFT